MSATVAEAVFPDRVDGRIKKSGEQSGDWVWVLLAMDWLGQ